MAEMVTDYKGHHWTPCSSCAYKLLEIILWWKADMPGPSFETSTWGTSRSTAHGTRVCWSRSYMGRFIYNAYRCKKILYFWYNTSMWQTDSWTKGHSIYCHMHMVKTGQRSNAVAILTAAAILAWIQSPLLQIFHRPDSHQHLINSLKAL